MSKLVTTSSATGLPASAGVPTEPLQCLTFQLGSEVFGLGILSIKEIIEYPSITQVPMMPSFVRGVINLRGAVVPVVDMQSRFGRAPSEVTKRSCIVIVEVNDAQQDEHQTIGVVVDTVNEVIDIAPGDIEPPPAFGANVQSEFIRGMAKVGGRFIILLDADRALNAAEITAISQATGQSATVTH
ncbi:chemotaxis protein CheW [Viridibacterium curvum]|uniref:Chemotaxis protein CheW n=1 Tax=Viridibacterium curvum TaxID=1101404 RepID=A0ABP9QXC8_9RHOO